MIVECLGSAEGTAKRSSKYTIGPWPVVSIEVGKFRPPGSQLTVTAPVLTNTLRLLF